MPGRTVQFVVMCITVSWKISLYDCVSITCTSSLKYSCKVKRTYLFSACVYFVVVFLLLYFCYNWWYIKNLYNVNWTNINLLHNYQNMLYTVNNWWLLLEFFRKLMDCNKLLQNITPYFCASKKKILQIIIFGVDYLK